MVFLANTPTQAESLLHNLEQAAGDVGLYVNANKIEYIYFNQEGAISALNDSPLKLVDKFTCFGSSVSSTESDVNIHLVKMWTAIDRLSIIWKSDLAGKIRQDFFQAAVVTILWYGCITWALTKCIEKKPNGIYSRMLCIIVNKSWKQHLMKQQLYSHSLPIFKSIQVRWKRHVEHCWRIKDKLISMFYESYTWMCQCWSTCKNLQQLCVGTGCSLEGLLGAMDNRARWRERVRKIHASNAIWWWYKYTNANISRKSLLPSSKPRLIFQY